MPDALRDADRQPRFSLSTVTMLVFLCGVALRWYWIFQYHCATDYVYSDMQTFFSQALRFNDPAKPFNIADTYVAPGMSFFLGYTHALDPTWQITFSLQFLMSVSIPILIYGIALQLYDRTVALLSLAVASLYFPFIDYAGFFLPENPYLFGMLLGFWLFLVAIRMSSSRSFFAVALLGGIALGAAVEFNPQGLLPSILVAVFLLYLCIRLKWKRLILVLAATAIGIALVIVPFTLRATKLNEGRFCLISNSWAMMFLVGHDPAAGRASFFDEERGIFFTYWPPPLADRNVDREEYFPFGAYETDKILPVAWERIDNNKIETLAMSFDHIYQLVFGSLPFPALATPYRRWADSFEKLYIVFILFPAGIYLMRNKKALWQRSPRAFSDFLLLLPLVGLCASAFLTIGESRFRIPFDSLMIILAMRFFVCWRQSPEAFTAGSWHSFRAENI